MYHEALFQVYHYPGTLDQRNFRHDIRGDFGQRSGTKLPSSEKCKPDIDAPAAVDVQSWLQGFVRQVGQQEATRLLEGVGRVHSWPLYKSST